jgi:hypothetical protein
MRLDPIIPGDLILPSFEIRNLYPGLIETDFPELSGWERSMTFSPRELRFIIGSAAAILRPVGVPRTCSVSDI